MLHMETNTILNLLSTGGLYILAPVAAYLTWAVQKRHTNLEKLFDRVQEMETSRAVNTVVLEHIEADIVDIKRDLGKLVEYKHG